MEIYRRRTGEIVDEFLDGAITFQECMFALDAALVDLGRRTSLQDHSAALRILISANNEIVRKELKRRWAQKSTTRRP